MREIGGYFPYIEEPDNKNHYLDGLCPKSDAYTIVFPYLDDATVPSHFTLYAADREKFKEYLSQNGIHATSYWPVGPYINLEGHTDCAYIYDHVISIPCDQRYTAEDMAYICRVLKDF